MSTISDTTLAKQQHIRLECQPSVASVAPLLNNKTQKVSNLSDIRSKEQTQELVAPGLSAMENIYS